MKTKEISIGTEFKIKEQTWEIIDRAYNENSGKLSKYRWLAQNTNNIVAEFSTSIIKMYV